MYHTATAGGTDKLLVCRVETRRGHWKVPMTAAYAVGYVVPSPVRSALCAQPVCSALVPSPCAQACVICCAQPCVLSLWAQPLCPALVLSPHYKCCRLNERGILKMAIVEVLHGSLGCMPGLDGLQPALLQHTWMSTPSAPPTAPSVVTGHPTSVRVADLIVGPCR